MLRTIPTAVALIACFCVAPAFAQPDPFVSLTLNPVSQTVGLGETADVVIGISGLGDFTPPALGAFNLGLGFDPAILSLNTVVFGDQVAGIDHLAPGGPGGSITDFGLSTPDTLVMYEISLESVPDLVALQPGAFDLATVTFNTVGPGTSPLLLGSIVLSDEWGNPLWPNQLFVPAEITVTSCVPAPGALLLGIAGVGFFARWRKNHLV
ncbi:MAG: hypothetical protein JW741_21200 [Sedimentisphaerales bacterium]|nr:hypothetical protein [Sedimentisphaerales bacterium]